MAQKESNKSYRERGDGIFLLQVIKHIRVHEGKDEGAEEIREKRMSQAVSHREEYSAMEKIIMKINK